MYCIKKNKVLAAVCVCVPLLVFIYLLVEFNHKWIFGLFFYLKFLLSVGIGILLAYFCWTQKWKSRQALLVYATALACLAAEILIGCCPWLLGQDFADIVWGKYHSRIDGIYLYDPQLKFNFMKPRYQTRCYFHGYWWDHQSDSKGFRNQVDREQAEIVLLGDSFIYGHGVNHNQTLGAYLEKISGHTVVNLGRQGDCIIQEAYFFEHYGLAYKPRYVCYFFFKNDIQDLQALLQSLKADSMESLPASWQKAYRQKPRPRKFPKLPYYLLSIIEQRPYLLQAIRLFWTKRHSENAKISPSGSSPRQAFAWQYIEQSLEKIHSQCKQVSAKLIMVPLTLGKEGQFQILKKIAKKHHLPFLDLRDMEKQPVYFLPGDGHWSSQGAREVARRLAEYLTFLEK